MHRCIVVVATAALVLQLLHAYMYVRRTCMFVRVLLRSMALFPPCCQQLQGVLQCTMRGAVCQAGRLVQ